MWIEKFFMVFISPGKHRIPSKIKTKQFYYMLPLFRVSGKHFPLLKWEKLTFFIHFVQFEGQHFPLGNIMKKGKVNLNFDLTLF